MAELGAFSNSESNTLLWVRAAPWMHSTASTSVLCPFCRQPGPGLGAHLLGGCIKPTHARLHAFRAVASHLASKGFDIRWRNVILFLVSSQPVPPVDVSLASDEDFSASRLSHRNMTITWSGLWIDREGAGLDLHRDDLLHHYVPALILAARGETWPLFEDVGDQCPSTTQFAAPWRLGA